MSASSTRVVLSQVHSSPRSLLIQGLDAPVLEDDWPDGIDYICPGCGRVLVKCVAEDQLWDLGVRCFNCSVECNLPGRPAGVVLPRCVLIPDGRYMLKTAVRLKRGAMCGQQAIDSRKQELKSTPVFFSISGSQPKAVWPPDRRALATLLDYFRVLLGERYQTLFDSDQRALQARALPYQRHPLMVPFRRVLDYVKSQHTEPSTRLLDAALELDAVRSILDRWRKHPDFDTFRLGLYAEYLHTVHTVALATLLEDLGNGVNLVRVADARSPDLHLVTGPRARAGCEVKSPRALYRPLIPVTADFASA